MEANHTETISQPLIAETERTQAHQTTKLQDSEQMNAVQAASNHKSLPPSALDGNEKNDKLKDPTEKGAMIQETTKETFFTDASLPELTESQVKKAYEQPREQSLFGAMSEVQPEQQQTSE